MRGLEKKKPYCPEAWASGLLLCPLVRHLQHFALEPVFAGIQKRNRAVRSLHARGYPPATPPTIRRDPNSLNGGVTLTHMPFLGRKAGRRDRRGMLVEIGEKGMGGGTFSGGWGVSEAGLGGKGWF